MKSGTSFAKHFLDHVNCSILAEYKWEKADVATYVRDPNLTEEQISEEININFMCDYDGDVHDVVYFTDVPGFGAGGVMVLCEDHYHQFTNVHSN